MRREMSPGLKILWVWTLGTAAVLITSVVRTRLKDMENLTNNSQQQQQQKQLQQPNSATDSETVLVDVDSSPPQSNDLIRED